MRSATKTRSTRYGELIASVPQSTPDQSPPPYQDSVLASTGIPAAAGVARASRPLGRGHPARAWRERDAPETAGGTPALQEPGYKIQATASPTCRLTARAWCASARLTDHCLPDVGEQRNGRVVPCRADQGFDVILPVTISNISEAGKLVSGKRKGYGND